MRHVSREVHFAAHRFGKVADAGGRKVHRRPLELPSLSAPEREYVVSEFETPDGEVVSRQVDVRGQCECWLRADLAAAAEAALQAEAAENQRIAAAVIASSLAHDTDRAAGHNMTLTEYRTRRNHALARIDRRRGRGSIGMG